MEHAITITSRDAELSAVLHYPVQRGDMNGRCRWPLVIVCHGFVGNKIGENRLFVKTARTLSEAGFMVLRFDYGGCGESTGDYGPVGSMRSWSRRGACSTMRTSWTALTPAALRCLGTVSAAPLPC